MTQPKPKPPAGWPFDRHLWEDDVWKDSPLNPKNWPEKYRPINVTEELKPKRKDHNDEQQIDEEIL